MNYALYKRYFGGSPLLAWLTLIEVGVWLAVMIISLAGRMMHFEVPIAEWLTLPSSFPVFITRPWTLITYMAVQFDVLHMLFNVLWLYWFGRLLLITLSDRHLAVLFFGGGVVGGIFFLCAAAVGFGGGWLCGCSAAVIAVMCGAAIRLPDHPVNLFLIGEVRLKWVALACCILTFLGGGGNQAAHIGGALFGIAAALLLRNGIDISSWIRILSLRMSSSGKPRRKADRIVSVLQQRQQDMQRLDDILDKIKISGYGSLSRRERKELNELTTRLKK